MKKKINKIGKRSFSEGDSSNNGWVGGNMEGHRLRLGQKPYNYYENPARRSRAELPLRWNSKLLILSGVLTERESKAE